jgi:hypothetical protein
MAEERNSSASWAERVGLVLKRRYRLRMEQWEDRLASRTTDRVVREFEWGLDWTRNWPCTSRVPDDGTDPASYLARLNEVAVHDDSRFFGYRTPSDFRIEQNLLKFTSAVVTPYPENNTVTGQWFPAKADRRRAVLVLPHWNARFHQHVALCRGLSRLGISALRISLPYHDLRMPGELQRADYAVSANVARTIDATRQAVIDSRSCLDWLEMQGYERLGIVGTSLGSCYAFLTCAQDKRLRSNVFNHFSLYFADVVWTGLSTRHILEGLEGNISLAQLRDAWKAIAPLSYVNRYAQYERESLFIYGTCDTTFLPEFSEAMIEQVRLRKIPYKLVVLPCGHYTLGETPFKYIDGYHICSFLMKTL